MRADAEHSGACARPRHTCAGRFGSLGHEEVDARTYASWGVDYLKYDNCNNGGRAGTPQRSFERYDRMSRALLAAGRPVLYSMCNGGEDGPWNFAVVRAAHPREWGRAPLSDDIRT